MSQNPQQLVLKGFSYTGISRSFSCPEDYFSHIKTYKFEIHVYITGHTCGSAFEEDYPSGKCGDVDILYH